MITIGVFGTEILAARFKQEIPAFKREQRKQMRIAANLVKKDVVTEVTSLFPSTTTAHKRRGATPLGPLRKKIGVRVFATTADVGAVIRPKASAFYGRFQETGLNVMRKRGKSSSPFHLPRRPFLEPVAEADVAKVTNIIGDAYGVFYSGGA